ncbi:MAG: hypothetical protein APF83_07945 [Lutibacter sp. BRH_c52]|nr:MAG: hypothetical protein APF83_07945 [Lutibacter sp. BRH_c52]
MNKTKKTNWRKQFFNWHMWLGIIITIPIILVSITAILIAHEKGLGTKDIAINAGWLPGYGSNEDIKLYLNDVKEVVIDSNKTYYASKLGVVIEEDKKLSIVKGTEGIEIRDLQFIDNQLWIASKDGLFISENRIAKLLKKGDFHGINIHNKIVTASEGKHGFHRSNDLGKSWESSKISSEVGKENLLAFTSAVENESYIQKLTLEKLVLDIHTGKAFFGEGSMWVWIDLIGISLLLIGFTGIWMWYKRKYGKKNKVVKNLK